MIDLPGHLVFRGKMSNDILLYLHFLWISICCISLLPLINCSRRRQQSVIDDNPRNQQTVIFGSKWNFAGPFVIGKTEIDVDPLAAFSHLKADNGESCHLRRILRRVKGCPSKFYSELSSNGFVGWNKLSHSEVGHNTHTVMIQQPLSNSHVDFNNLIQGLSKMTVLEFQGWATNKFTVSGNGGSVSISCTHVHSFFIDGILYAGDVYGRSLAPVIVTLVKGSHYLDIRIRAKQALQFTCSMSIVDSNSEHMLQLGSQTFDSDGSDSTATDLLEGRLPFDVSSWIQLPLTNRADHWLTNLKVTVLDTTGKQTDQNTPKVEVIHSNNKSTSPSLFHVNVFDRIPPRHTQYYPIQFTLTTPRSGKIDNTWWRRYEGKDSCLSFSVVVSGNNKEGGEVSSNPIAIALRCRHAFQSFIFTFPDKDGSVAHAAAIQPHALSQKQSSSKAYPVLLALSGVGVTTRSQADSFKYKSKPSDKDYTFGLNDAWILAPCRNGAHNWEGTGFWNMVQALDYFGSLKAINILSSKVVVAGHSRGGHGALTFATHFPDRTQAVITASGYADRESYGDANILFDLDPQLSYMDPQLLGVMLSTIHEHDNTQSMVNLKDMDVFVRAGSADRTVHPYFQRQIARTLTAEGANVTYSEKVGADHWYWDFDNPEDGGVVFDPLTRKFINHHLQILLTNGTTQRHESAFEVVSWNPATFGSVRGVTITQMKSRLQKAVLRLQQVWLPDNLSGHESCQQGGNEINNCNSEGALAWEIRPSNVLSFSIAATFWSMEEFLEPSAHSTDVHKTTRTIKLGSQYIFDVDIHRETNQFCIDKSVNRRIISWILCNNVDTVLRSTQSYGPARQVFQSPFNIIVGTGTSDINSSTVLSNDILMDIARYISVGYLHGSASIAPILLDTDIDLTDLHGKSGERFVDSIKHNWVLIGGPDVNAVSRAVASQWPGHFPIQFGDHKMDRLTFNGCDISVDTGLAFTHPVFASNDPSRIGLMITGSSLESITDAVSYSFSGNTPLTRSPFSNMYADYFIVGPELKKKGLGGLRAHGYWTDSWGSSDSSGWSSIEC